VHPMLRKAIADPGRAFGYALALLKGHFYKVYYPLTGRRFTAGRRLRVHGRLSIRGPGRVVFGDDVIVWLKVTPWTMDADAIIEIGDRTRLSDTNFSCVTRISVGPDCNLGESRFLDTDFHPVGDAPVRVAPIEIGHHVWIGMDSVVLPGAKIGDHSVVSIMSVVSGTFPPKSIIVGNPARAVAKVQLKEEGAAVPPAPPAAAPRLPSSPTAAVRE
jgi:acetyltransferase-like isoleucine patch superfamily enzyme